MIQEENMETGLADSFGIALLLQVLAQDLRCSLGPIQYDSEARKYYKIQFDQYYCVLHFRLGHKDLVRTSEQERSPATLVALENTWVPSV